MLHLIAKLRRGPYPPLCWLPQVLKGLAAAMRRQLDSFRPADLAAAVKAMAKMKFNPGEDVMRKIAARAGRLHRQPRPAATTPPAARC